MQQAVHHAVLDEHPEEQPTGRRNRLADKPGVESGQSDNGAGWFAPAGMALKHDDLASPDGQRLSYVGHHLEGDFP